MTDKKISKYDIIEKNLKEDFLKEARQMPAISCNIEYAYVWQKQAKRKLWELLSLDKFNDFDIQSKIVERYRTKEFIREKVILYTEIEVEFPICVLLPVSKIKRKIPFVFIIQGNEELQTADNDLPQDKEECLALRLVSEGYGVVVMAEKFFACSTDKLNKMSIALGYSLTGINIWNAMRIIDYIQKRSEFDDRLFCGGHSGGGMLSLYLSAVDERIQGTFVSGYLYGFQDTLFRQSRNCTCNFIPSMYKYFDICDIASMIAPRPLFIKTGDEDGSNEGLELENACLQIKETRKMYRCFEVEKRLHHTSYSGEHENCPKSQDVIEFINKCLLETDRKS